MAGDTGEVVASCVNGKVGESEFTTTELSQYMDLGYIDRYNTNKSTIVYTARKLGDATGKMGPFYSYYTATGKYDSCGWYSDYANFITSSIPWFHRGGGRAQGSIAGIFYFGAFSGGLNTGQGFRIAVAI